MSSNEQQNDSVAAFDAMPDARGHFGIHGGMFVSETLMAPLQELREAYEKYREDPEFKAELVMILKTLSVVLHHYISRVAGRKKLVVHASTLNVKTSIIPAHTKLIIPSARFYWLNVWVKNVLSLRPVLVNMV